MNSISKPAGIRAPQKSVSSLSTHSKGPNPDKQQVKVKAITLSAANPGIWQEKAQTPENDHSVTSADSPDILPESAQKDRIQPSQRSKAGRARARARGAMQARSVMAAEAPDT